MPFDDKARAPDDKALTKGLGTSKALWDDIVAHIAASYAPVTEAWGFYKTWSLRLKRKDRTVLYLLPGDGGFRCAFVLGAKATEAARKAKLPKAVLKAIDDAPVYAEGRGFRFEVRTAKDVATVKTLAAVKMAG
jgi:hypothetical protein